MSNGILRIVAKVQAVLSRHWHGRAGERFRKTVSDISEGHDPAMLAQQGAKRLVVGKLSREHAEAVRNYADEEDLRIEAEFKRRTIDDRVRQEQAKTDQEEVKARILRVDEVTARLVLFEKLKQHGALPI